MTAAVTIIMYHAQELGSVSTVLSFLLHRP